MGRSYAAVKDQKSDGQRRDPRGPRHGLGNNFTFKPDHPAILENRTRYPHMVGKYSWPPLKSGYNNAKIGKVVTKGKWAGMPIYTLTLEERKTCGPCGHKLDCYGNKMLFAARQVHGPSLEAALAENLEGLSVDHPKGFVVRLHVLGDFYSVEYVAFWRKMLDTFPAIRVYGYTARRRGTPIGDALDMLFATHVDRFAMRWSDAPWPRDATVSVDSAQDAPNGSIVCPAQTEKTACCATCGLCWDTRKNIAFISH